MDDMNDDKSEITIENLVISGGGPAGFAFYGVLKELCKKEIIESSNIKNIYANSAGCIIAVIFALGYSWEEIDKYLIERPWSKIFKIQLNNIFAAYEKRGLYNVSVFHQILDPLLLGKGLEPNVTLKEFYEFRDVKLNFISTKIRNMSMETFNYETHPNWQLCDVILCSCSVPVLFTPFFYDNDLLCDGGFMSNYPVDSLLSDKLDPNKTIGISISPRLTTDEENNNLNQSSEDYNNYNLLDYLITLFFHLIFSVNKRKNKTKLYKEIFLDYSHPLIASISNVLSEQHFREELIQYGIDCVNDS
tara:strand:- start:6305 stop:7216 length:912 start_codon:yes stop_codon:yes gene_type:complete